MASNPLDLAPIVPDTGPARVPGPEPLNGRYVTLQRLNQSHFADLWENMGAPPHAELWTWWPDDAPSTRSAFDDSMDEFLKFLPGDLFIYAVSLNEGPNKGKAAGLGMVLSEDRESHRVAELGAFFGPLLQRTTAGTEAMYILANLMFELNHRRLGWKTNSLNVASRRAAERYGFVYEGTFRQNQINKGRNRDSVMYSIIDSEWPVCKKAFEIWLEEANFDEEGKQRRRIEEIRESLK